MRRPRQESDAAGPSPEPCAWSPERGGGGRHGAPGGGARRCASCLARATPQWRTFSRMRGASGPVTLCNACGVRYVRSGSLRLAVTTAGGASEASGSSAPASPCSAAAGAASKASTPGGPGTRGASAPPTPPAGASPGGSFGGRGGGGALRRSGASLYSGPDGLDGDTLASVGAPPTYDMRDVPAFAAGAATVKQCTDRDTWLRAVGEMHALCDEAAARAHRKGLGEGEPWLPISRDFIAQRADIDDPIRGFVVRTKAKGWLQGFVWYTTFTNWTHYFRWDSLISQAGLRGQKSMVGRAADMQNVLGAELEALERDGDPLGEGVVWPKVAEVALVGGLGCGRLLMDRLLDELEQETSYEYVVLQATKDSVGFYEKFGFQRVGAVARYNNRRNGSPTEIVGYRHWLATDDRLERSDKTSYMMARRLDVSRRARHCVCKGPTLRLGQKSPHILTCAGCKEIFHPECVEQLSGARGRAARADAWRCAACRTAPAHRPGGTRPSRERAVAARRITRNRVAVAPSPREPPRPRPPTRQRHESPSGFDEEDDDEVDDEEPEEEEEEESDDSDEDYAESSKWRGTRPMGARGPTRAGVAAKTRVGAAGDDDGGAALAPGPATGFVIKSRWGMVQHRAGCVCRCCKRQRLLHSRDGGQTRGGAKFRAARAAAARASK